MFFTCKNGQFAAATLSIIYTDFNINTKFIKKYILWWEMWNLTNPVADIGYLNFETCCYRQTFINAVYN